MQSPPGPAQKRSSTDPTYNKSLQDPVQNESTSRPSQNESFLSPSPVQNKSCQSPDQNKSDYSSKRLCLGSEGSSGIHNQAVFESLLDVSKQGASYATQMGYALSISSAEEDNRRRLSAASSLGCATPQQVPQQVWIRGMR